MAFVSSLCFLSSLLCSYSFHHCCDPVLFYFIYFLFNWTTLPVASVFKLPIVWWSVNLSFFILVFTSATHSWFRWLSLHLITLSHTHILSRTALDKGSARHTDFHSSPHNIHKRQTSIPPAEFEPATPPSKRQQTYILDRAAPGIGWSMNNEVKIIKILDCVTEKKTWKIFLSIACVPISIRTRMPPNRSKVFSL
jgi:hypothetical protein